MTGNRKVILFIAMSLDGYIAGPGDDLRFLSQVQEEGEDYGYADFIRSVDTVIIGRKTYDWVRTQVEEFPHAGKETYVITRTPRGTSGKVHFYTGDLVSLIDTLKSRPGKKIFVDGGAEIVQCMLGDKLIDELQISVIPVLLGGGKQLFKGGLPVQDLALVAARSFPRGLVQLHYTVLRGKANT